MVKALPTFDFHRKLQNFDRVIDIFRDDDGGIPSQQDIDVCPDYARLEHLMERRPLLLSSVRELKGGS